MRKRINHKLRKTISGIMVTAMVVSGVPAPVLTDFSRNVYAAQNFGINDSWQYLDSVTYGETVTLDAQSQVYFYDNNVSLNYTWKKYNKTTGEYDVIAGATAGTYEAEMVNFSYGNQAAFLCEVSEEGSEDVETIGFYVYGVETDFTMESPDYDQTHLEVSYGEDFTLQVTATSKSPITYTWYYQDESTYNWVLIEGEDKASFTKKADQDAHRYYKVDVNDGYEYDWYNNVVQFTVDVDTGFDYEYSDSRVSVNLGEEKELSVSVSSLADITYQWQYYDEQEYDYKNIDGATKANYGIKGDKSLHKEYRCKVSDGFNSQTFYFNTSIDTGFEVDYSYYQTVEYGKKKALTVDATTGEGLTLTYQWYGYDESKGYNEDTWDYYWPIEGATDCSYEIEGTKDVLPRYSCKVTDGYNSTDCKFNVTLDTGFECEYGDDSNGRITVPYNGQETMKIEASTNTEAGISYQWYAYDRTKGYFENTYDYYWPVEGATEASYTVTGTKDMVTRYKCTVTDGIKNQNMTFNLTLDSGLKLEDYENRVTVLFGEKKNLEVKATCAEGMDIAYQWYVYDNSRYNQETGNYWNPVEGATGASIEVEGKEDMFRQYRCEISDGIVTLQADFNLSFDSGLVVEGNSYLSIAVKYNSTATLETNAKSITGREVTYTWSVDQEDTYNYEELPEAANQATLTVKGEKGLAKKYKCVISDGITTKTKYYTLTLDSGFDVNYKSYVNVKYGKTADLKINAKTDTEEGLTYTWYVYKDEDYQLLEDVKTSTYTVKGDADLATDYRCTVTDGVNTEDAYFSTYLDTGLSVSYEEDVLIGYQKKGSISVNAVSEAGLPLTFKWSYRDEGDGYSTKVLENEVTDTIELEVTKELPTTYYCEVSDGYTTRNATITVTKETELGVVYKSSEKIVYGQKKELSVTAESGYGLPITYQWYKAASNYDSYSEIEGATEPVLTIEGTKDIARAYKCVVTDGVVTKEVGISVELDTRLTAGAESSVAIPYEKQAELKVTAASGVDLPLTYQWYAGYAYNSNLLEGETTDTLALTGTTDLKSYYTCVVSDGITSKSVRIDTTLDTGLTLAYESEVSVKYQQTAVLTVEATSELENPVSYQWYAWNQKKYDYDKIPEATLNQLTVKGTADLAKQYKCVVSDTVIKKDVIIETTLDTGFSVDYNKKTITVGWDESVALQVTATSDEALPLQYQWYVSDWSKGYNQDIDDYYWPVEGATETSYTVKGDKNLADNYMCFVTNTIDKKKAIFTTQLATGLTVDNVDDISVKQGEQATLEVFAETDLDAELTYAWSVYDDYEDEYVALENETASSFTVTGAKDMARNYRCVVSDGVMNKDASFTVSLDTGLQVTTDNYNYVDVPYKKTVDLAVEAESELEYPLTYKWYKGLSNSSYGTYALISGEDKATLTVKGLRGMAKYYRCVVSDGINSQTIQFNTTLTSGLKVSYQYSQTFKYGEKGQLKVEATTEADSDLTYQWSTSEISWNQEEIAGANASTYEVVADENMNPYYWCTVSDGISSSTVRINAFVDTGLTVGRVETDRTVKYGDELTIEVPASSDYTEELTYSWKVSNTGAVIEGAVTNSLTVKGEEGAEKGYTCYVSDGINTRSVTVWVTVDSGLTVEAEENVTVEYEKTADLTVTASSSLGRELTYQWYYYDDDEYEYCMLAGETEATYTVTGTKNMVSDYRCVVSDGIVIRTADITATLDSGLRVSVSTTEPSIKYNETKELLVVAETKAGDEITYRWYHGRRTTLDNLIKDAKGEKLSVTADKDTAMAPNYTCVVSDGICSETVLFDVNVDTGFICEYEPHVDVEFGAEAVCTITAATDLPDGVQFSWSKFTYSEEEGNYVREDLEITGNTCKVMIDRNMPRFVMCELTDGVNSAVADFFFNVDSKINVSEGKTIALAEKEKATLQVTATSGIGEELSYQWFVSDIDDETGEAHGMEVIDGAYGPTLTVTGDGIGNVRYTCEVSDRYSEKWVYFDVVAKADCVYGDVDGDGEVTAKDITLLKKYLAGYRDIQINKQAADVNLDGKISGADCVLIAEHLAGYGVELGKGA